MLISEVEDEPTKHGLTLLLDAFRLQLKHRMLEESEMMRCQYVPLFNDMEKRREAWMKLLRQTHLILTQNVANVLSFSMLHSHYVRGEVR